MLGEAFYQEFKDEFDLKVTDIDTNEPWISFLDFRDLLAYREDVKNFKPDYLFHLGAHTNLEYCEKNTEDAYLTNTQSVEYAVGISNELGIPLLYISTAGIFDGDKGAYDDWDIPNPIGHYARSKYFGEKFVIANKKEHLVCRAGWMMGGGPKKDKKFVGAILRLIRSGQTVLNIVNDKFGTPTYTHDFARNVIALLKGHNWGIYNMACVDQASRIEMTDEILRVLNKQEEIVLREVNSDFFKEEYFAPRPPSEILVNSKLNDMKMNLMRDWKVCLKEYIRDYYKEYFTKEVQL